MDFDSSGWAPEKRDWGWITSGNLQTFNNPLDPGDGLGMSNTARSVRDNLGGRYLPVVWPEDETQNRLPRYDEAEKSYEPGTFTGRAMVVDLEKRALVCMAALAVKGSETVSVRTGGRRLARLANENPAEAVLADFQDNKEAAMVGARPEGSSLRLRAGNFFD